MLAFDPGVYNWIKLGHVIAAILWVDAALGDPRARRVANTIVVGAAFIGPEAGRLGRLTEERALEDPEVQRRIQRIFTISRYDLAVLVLVVADVVIKPGL